MNTIQIEYHPALKKIIFSKHENNESTLFKYKGKEFVLQQMNGNQLCDDIVNAVSDRKVIVEMITTKEDFKDFESMVEEYNKSQQEREISTTLLAELPDMNSLYQKIVEYGSKIVEHVSSNKETSNAQTTFVKKIETEFSEKIDENITSIRKHIESMKDNNINLCVTGAYSTGKSVLINAILGYEILPHAIESKTANTFRIKSPSENEKELHFIIDKTLTILQWNDKKEKFEFVTEKPEPTQEILSNIYNKINDLNDSSLESHQQLYKIIDILNINSEHISDILIKFPIPLDTDSCKFTIYDTPGTDSNYEEHQDVLNKALEEQTHSIMIFVVSPKKLEGAGNKTILNSLKDKESNKTNIDIDRSIFVMNQSDGVDTLDELQKLQESKISIDSISIELKNQKLFFLSALQGYIAKATKEGSKINDKKHSVKKHFLNVDPNDENEQYYLSNLYGQSDIRTKQIVENSNNKLQSYSDTDTDSKKADQIIVSSGLHALESEIKNYGEKYSIAVRAYSIITSVKSFLKTLNNEFNALETRSTEELVKIDEAIKAQKDDIVSKVKKSAEHLMYNDSNHYLQLSEKDIKRQINRICDFAKNNIPWVKKALGLDWSGDSVIKIEREFGRIQEDLVADLKARYKKKLETKNNEFKEEIKKIIANAKIDENFKEYVSDISIPEVPLENTPSVSLLFEKNKEEWVLWVEVINKDDFINDLREASKGIYDDISNDLEPKLVENNKKCFDKMIDDVERNIGSYSDIIKAHIENKGDVEKFRERLSVLRDYIKKEEIELEKEIWKKLDA